MRRAIRVPLASTSGGINDGLGSFDRAEATSKESKELVIGGRVKAANIDIAVARDAILKTLLNALHLTRRGEDSGNSLGNGRLLSKNCIELSIADNINSVLGSIHVQSSHAQLLRRRRGIRGAIVASNARGVFPSVNATPEGSSRGRFIGGIRTTTVLKGRDIGMNTFSAVLTYLPASWSERDESGHRHLHTVESTVIALALHLTVWVLIMLKTKILLNSSVRASRVHDIHD